MKAFPGYESLSGAALTAAQAAVRRHPQGVDVRDLDAFRVTVEVVPVNRGVWPYRYGVPLASVQVSDCDPVLAAVAAHQLVRAFASQPRVRDGRAAVLARRVIP